VASRRRVVWSPEARQDLANIYHYIKVDNAKAARKVTDVLRNLVKALPDQPWRGRKVPEHDRDDLREIIHSHYRIVYELAGDADIYVLQIFHAAQEEFEL
jgi:addiction module RelE/StbE family toxin